MRSSKCHYLTFILCTCNKIKKYYYRKTVHLKYNLMVDIFLYSLIISKCDQSKGTIRGGLPRYDGPFAFFETLFHRIKY